MQEYDPNKTSRIKTTVTSLRSDHIYMKGAVEDNNTLMFVFFFCFKLNNYHLLHVAVRHEAVHGPRPEASWTLVWRWSKWKYYWKDPGIICFNSFAAAEAHMEALEYPESPLGVSRVRWAPGALFWQLWLLRLAIAQSKDVNKAAQSQAEFAPSGRLLMTQPRLFLMVWGRLWSRGLSSASSGLQITPLLCCNESVKAKQAGKGRV